MISPFIKFLVLSLFFGLVVSQIPRRSERPKNRDRVTKRTTTTKAPEYSDEEDGTSSDCPEPNGYFADADQCDKYYACTDGQIEERLCSDGLVFNDYDINVEKCDLPYNLDCSSKSKLQTPIPSPNCPRKNGYFGSADKNVCDKFFYCVDGMFNAITCPAGLVFNPKTGICTWPDQAQKLGCSSEDVFNFSCQKVNESIAVTHPRYSDPEDCQYFYVCINGNIPRRNGCKLGQVFNGNTKSCDWPRNVPGCTDFYKDRLTDKELEEIEFPITPKPNKEKSATGVPRRKSSRPTRKVIIEEDDE